jgi:multiple sugar transport system substrate-binding protein
MSKTRARLIAGAVAAATVALSLAGCSSNAGSDSGSDTTLTYWASNQGTSLQNDKEVLTPVLKKFTKETGIKVKLQVIGWNDLQTKIQTAVTSGQGPDVVNIGNTWGTWLQSTGAFLELNDENAKKIGGLDKFVKTALDAGGAPGKTPTSVPLYGLAYGLYYNKAMFQDAGLTPPTTWEELVTDAQKLTKPDGSQWGISLAAASYTENVHFAFLTAAQNGAEFYNSKGKPTFTSDAITSGLKRYLDLMQTDKVVNPSNAQYDNGAQAVADFATGKAAMVLSQSNAGASIKSNGMADDAYGVVTLPAPEDAKAQISTFPAGINLSVFNYTKNKDAALKFVKYMTSEDTQTTLDKPYSALPVLKGATASFTDNQEQAKVFLDAYNNKSEPLPQVATEGDFESTVGKALSNMFAKIASGGTVTDSDIESALKDAQQQVEAQG